MTRGKGKCCTTTSPTLRWICKIVVQDWIGLPNIYCRSAVLVQPMWSSPDSRVPVTEQPIAGRNLIREERLGPMLLTAPVLMGYALLPLVGATVTEASSGLHDGCSSTGKLDRTGSVGNPKAKVNWWFFIAFLFLVASFFKTQAMSFGLQFRIS